MALLSKTAVAPLPVVLLGLAWWQRGRVTRRDVWRSAPFFAASLVLGLITVWFERHVAAGSVMIVRDDSFWSRLAVAGRAVWFYLYKALVPLNLMSIYPRWQTDPSKALSYVPGALVVGALLLLWWKRGRWGRVWLFCAAYYVAMLLPVLGFVNIGFMSCSLVADHWQYFSILAPIAVVAAGIASLKSKVQSLKPKVQSPKAEVRRPKSEGRRLKSRFQGGRGLVGTAVCGAMLVGLGGLTWRQSALYANAETLWQGTLAVNPGCQQAHYGLADAYFRKGKLAEAAAELKTTLRLKPDHIEAQKRLADLLLKMGEAAEAIPYCEAVVKAEPKDAHAHFVLGSACLASKRLESAVASYREAVQLAPDTPECLNALAWIYATCPKAELRNGAEAVRLAERACVLTKRQKTAMLDTLAAAYAEAGRFDDAVKIAEEIRALAVLAHDTNTADTARQRLALYQAGKPYRDEP
jgi:tetratricopeptide (TPR) repeat protein